MQVPIKQLLLPAAVTGLVAGILLTTPEIIAQVVGFSISFIVSLMLLLIFAWLAPVARWRTGVRRLAIWLVAACGAVAPYGWLLLRR